MVTANLPYDFIELHGSGKESYTYRDGIFEATRIFRGDWSKRFLFLQEMFPPVTVQGGNIIFTPPLTYPNFPSAYAYRAELVGKLKPGVDFAHEDMIEYDRVEITVYYRTPSEELGGTTGGSTPSYNDPELSVESFTTDIQVITIPPEALKDGNGVAWIDDPEFFTKINPIITYNITQRFVLTPNWSEINNSLGKVNNATFTTISGLSAAPGYILYKGPAATRSYLFSGAKAWEITHAFTYNSVGWNKRFNTKTGTIDDIYLFDGTTPFETYDINKVFNVPTS